MTGEDVDMDRSRGEIGLLCAMRDMRSTKSPTRPSSKIEDPQVDAGVGERTPEVRSAVICRIQQVVGSLFPSRSFLPATDVHILLRISIDLIAGYARKPNGCCSYQVVRNTRVFSVISFG